MRVSLCQTAGYPGDVPANLKLLEQFADRAAAQGARLLVLPELFLTGYHLGEALLRLAEPADGPSAQAVSRIARQSGLALLYGYPERDGAAVYNAALIVDASGQPVANARKAHLWGPEEARWFSAGSHLALARLEGMRVGLLICYDLEFPEAARALALAGADLIAVPTALPEHFGRVAELLVPARAYENQVFVAYADRCGEEHGLSYAGLSRIVAPDGALLAGAGTQEALLTADVVPEAYTRSREQNPYVAQRRPALYAQPVRTGR